MAKVLGIIKTFRRVGTSCGTRWEPGMRTVRGRGAGTRPLLTRSWGGAHIVLYSDGLRTCACRLDSIFRSGNIYFGAVIHISERQNIFQSSITYFRGGGMHTVRTRWRHGENDKLELYEDEEFGTRQGRTRYRPGIDRYGPGDKWKKICLWEFTACHLYQMGMGPLCLAGATRQHSGTFRWPRLTPKWEMLMSPDDRGKEW